MEFLNRRPSLILLTVGALVAMLAVGALVVIQLRPGPEVSKPSLGAAKVEQLQALLRQLPEQRRLEQALATAGSGLPADLLAATEQLESIKPTSPVYPVARDQARLWSGQLVAFAEAEAKVGSPEALRSAIALLSQLPPGDIYAGARTRIRQWQQRLNLATAPPSMIPASDDSRLSLDRSAVPMPALRPADALRELSPGVEQTLDGVTLAVSSVRIQSTGEYRLNLMFANASSQRFIFLPSLVRLEDTDGADRVERIELNQERGILAPGATARLLLYGRAPWQPPYHLRLEENRISGQRDFNLLLPQ